MRLFRILNQLPRTSHFHAAVHNDDERVSTLIGRDGDEKEGARPPRPPLETWTQEAELLALIADLLAHQRADFAQVHSKHHRWRAPKPTPRPETACERAQRRSEHQRHRDIVASMLST
ncbi:hypothetical protein [Saccharopolyspora taberi]|uniref:Uncharacterized protein n=1 Tax=Saccharopolyspora taberi TaxID=60895 RepID=A0ABN3VKD6_9PSEU